VRDVPDLVRRAGSPGCRDLDHAPVTRTAQAAVRPQIAHLDRSDRGAAILDETGVGRLDEPGVGNRLNAHICAPYITVARMLTLSFCSYWPYSSSLTLSIHSTTLPSSASAIAMCVMAVVGDAPCHHGLDHMGSRQ
jgi:hypothetical protein